jgi:hypothetical protein
VANTRSPIDYSQVLWAQGKPYWVNAAGEKVFIPPITAGQLNDPRAQAWAKSMGYGQDATGRVTQNDVFDGREASFSKNRGNWNSETGEIDQDTDWTNIIGTGLASVPLAAGALTAAGVGAGGGASASTAPSVNGISASLPGAVTSQGVTSGGGAKVGGIKGILSKIFGKGGIDPTTALLGGLSMFGGEGQERGSFEGTGADPVKGMEETVEAIRQMGARLSAPRTPQHTRVSRRGPSPIQIDGLPFQIGGGLGMDPATRNLSPGGEPGKLPVEQPDLMNPEGAPRTATRRREPV